MLSVPWLSLKVQRITDNRPLAIALTAVPTFDVNVESRISMLPPKSAHRTQNKSESQFEQKLTRKARDVQLQIADMATRASVAWNVLDTTVSEPPAAMVIPP